MGSKSYFRRAIPLILFLGIVSTLSLGRAAEAQEAFAVPEPPEAKLVDTHQMRMGGLDISNKLYSSPKGVDEIAEYYRKLFTQKEFRTIFDKKDASRRALRFQKQEQVVSFALMPKNGETQVIIAQYLQPKGAPPPEKAKPAWGELLASLPKQDMAGEDLKFIPRPPDSVRLSAVSLANTQFLAYTSGEPSEKVKEFYKTQMFVQGWEAVNEISMADTINEFKQKSGKKAFTVNLPFPDLTLDQIVQGSYMLNFKGYWGTAQVNIFNNNYGERKGSFVQIRYVQK